MRVLFQHGSYQLLNMGDVAMLQLSVARIRRVYPHAEIRVLTSAPARLRHHVRDAVPISLSGLHSYLREHPMGSGFIARFEALAERHRRCRDYVRNRFPLRWATIGGLLAPVRGHVSAGPRQLIHEIRSADLVIAAGGGYINDLFPSHAIAVLTLLHLANTLGKETALSGQGLGPLTSDRIKKLAALVFPRVRMLSLRERLHSPSIAKELGAANERTIVTGDDAIELAHSHNNNSGAREHLGISLRLAEYAGATPEVLVSLRDVIRRFASEVRTSLLPIPISFRGEEDCNAMRSQFPEVVTDACLTGSRVTVSDIISIAGRCRLVVTGCYHAAVFSLSQGIPVVGTAMSRYYEDKFTGLADQFGPGCRVVSWRNPGAANALAEISRELWDTAEQYRESLMEAAARQIDAGHRAYSRMLACVSPRCSA